MAHEGALRQRRLRGRSSRIRRRRSASASRALSLAAREVRFVPVDFTRDALDRALADAGHDPSRPTTWVWEGVIMYLEPAAVAATLAVVQRRSAPKSRVLAFYSKPKWSRRFIGLLVALLREPYRSEYRPEEMAELLACHGFPGRWRHRRRGVGARERRRSQRPLAAYERRSLCGGVNVSSNAAWPFVRRL